MRTPSRRARAIESDGRALTSTPLREREDAVEDALAQVGDADLGELLAGRDENVAEQVMGQRPRRDDALLGVGDRACLCRPYPDGQEAFAVDLPEQDDRLVRRHLNPDTNDVELAHSSTLPRRPP